MRPSGGFVTNCCDSNMSRRSAIVDTGRPEDEEDDEDGGTEEGEEEDGARDTDEAVVVAVLTLGRISCEGEALVP